MIKYWQIIKDSYSGYWNYLVEEVLNPTWHNYFYWLIALSLLIWLLEIAKPWRKNQRTFRKDFWLDGFYIFFNFFLFSLIVYNGLSNVAVEAFNNFLGLFAISNLVAIELQSLPVVVQFLLAFVIADFIQWNMFWEW